MSAIDKKPAEDLFLTVIIWSLIRQPTSYKTPNNPTCIHKVLRNKYRSLKSFCVTENFTSWHWQLIGNTLKSYRKPTVIHYRLYEQFLNKTLGACFKNKIADRIFSNSNCDLQIFCHRNLDILNKLVPCKKSTVNQMPFITKMLSKAMERTLQNNFLETKLRKTKFSIQRHYCLSFEKN